MNYRDFFDKALSEAYTEAPIVDDKEFVGSIYERAKGMSNNNEKVKQVKFTEITPEYTEPKKSHKALNVFAGVAGTAAVLTGAMFGLKFLNEHGGLKEGGSNEISAGAAYHEDVSEPVQSEAAVTENAIVAGEDVRDKIEINAVGKAVNGVVPMDETVELDDVTVHFTGYDSDSEMVRFYYDEIYEAGVEPVGLQVLPADTADAGIVLGGANGIWEGGSASNSNVRNILHCTATVAVNGTPAYLIVPFVNEHPVIRNEKTYSKGDEAFTVKVYYDPDITIQTFWSGEKVKINDNGDTLKFRDGFVTPNHIMVHLKNPYGLSEETLRSLTAEILMKNGETVNARLTTVITKDIIQYETNTNPVWLRYDFDEPIDITELAEASFAGFTFYGDEWQKVKEVQFDRHNEISDIEYSPLFTSADEWFDLDDKRVHVTGYVFDGITLRIRYDTCYDYSVNKDNIPSMDYSIVFSDGSGKTGYAEIYSNRCDEGIITKVCDITTTVPVHTLNVPFGDNIFTAYVNPEIPMIESDIDKVISVIDNETIRYNKVVLTPGNLSLMMSESTGSYINDKTDKYRYDNEILDLDPVITFNDGSTLNLKRYAVQPAGTPMPDGYVYKFWQFKDSIEINKVTSITVDGLEIYSAENSETAE